MTEEAISTVYAIAVQEAELKATADWRQRTAETQMFRPCKARPRSRVKGED